MKKSSLQNSLPSLEKHFSDKFNLQSKHCIQLWCHALSRTLYKYWSRIGRSHPAHLINVLELLLLLLLVEFDVGGKGEEAAVCTFDLLVIFNGVLLFDFDFELRVFLFDDFLLVAFWLLGWVVVIVADEDGNCAVKSLKLTPIMSSFNVFSNNKLLFVVVYDNCELFM